MKKKMIKEVLYSTLAGTRCAIQFWAGEVAEVSILSYPILAKETLARAVRGYTGNYEDQDIKQEEIDRFFHDLKHTKLGTPTEFLNFVFLVRDVPRSWTHQAVRTRIGASYVQESTRFIGARALYKVLVPKTALLPDGVGIWPEYFSGTVHAISNYADLVEKNGVASQDARQLLPHSLLTHMFWSINLSALMRVYNQRHCCQAESSTWQPVMKQMKEKIAMTCGNEIASFLTAPIDRGESCGFDASFDRKCTWRERVDPNLR